MTQTQQPEGLRLAHALTGGKLIDDSTEWADTLHDAAALLLRQQARIEELETQLSATPTTQEGWCDGCSPDNCCGCGPGATQAKHGGAA